MKIEEFKLEEFFAIHEFSAPYLLCSSDCESFSVEELLALDPESENDFKKLKLGYTESLGNPDLRKEISNLYETIEPDDIIVFAGAEEGIFIFMNGVLDKGDRIICEYPAYQSLYQIAESIGCEVTKWVMSENNQEWDLDVDFLRDNVKDNTKAIVLNNPHNPTGHLMSKRQFNEIIEIAREGNIYVFSDEVYRYIEYDENERLPAACDVYDKGISLGVMSKTFGLAGLRIGWIATKDKSLYKKIASFKNYTTICNSAPSGFLSILALKNKEHLIKRNLSIINENLKLLDEFFGKYEHLFIWLRPKAGSIAFPKINFNQNIDDFCLDILDKKGVLLMPGTKFDFGDKYFRIGFGRKQMSRALKRLEEYIKENF